MNLTPEYRLWLESLLVLGIGTGVIVGAAAAAARVTRSAVWQRTLWRVALLGLAALVVTELTGVGAAVVELCRGSGERVGVQGSGFRISEVERDGRAEPESALANSQSPRTAFRGAADEDVPSDIEPRVPIWPSLPTEFSEDSWDAEDLRSGQSLGRETGYSQGSRLAPRDGARHTECDGYYTAHYAGRDADRANYPAASIAAHHAERVGTTAARPWWPALLWGLGLGLVLAQAAWARGMLAWFRRRRAVEACAELRGRVDRLARRLGMRRPVAVLEAAGLSTPVAFGCRRPTVAVPAGFADEFGACEQDAVLAHELAHLAAGDPLWQLGGEVVCAVLWWHPLAWWARRRLRAAGEAAADEASLLVPGGPDVLAECLVAWGRKLAGHRRLGWLSFAADYRSGLGRRVERLLGLSHRRWRPFGRGRALVAHTAIPVLLLFVAVTCTAWARPRAVSTEGGTTMNVFESAWQRSLAAAVVLAFWAPGSGDAAENPSADVPQAANAVADGADLGLLLAQREGDGDAHHPEETRIAPDRPRDEGERRDVEHPDRPRGEGDREVRRDGDRPEGEHPDRPRREGDREVRREGDRPEGDREVRREREGGDREEGERAERRDRDREEGAEEREHREHEEAEHRERGEREEAEHREHEEREEAEHREREEREGPRGELEREIHRLEERAGDIHRELEGLRDDQDERAEQLQREFREIQERLEHHRREMRGPEGGERAQLERRLNELREAFQRAMEQGREEEAGRFRREAEEIQRRWAGRMEREHPHPHPDRPEGIPEEAVRRIQHLRAAAENLAAAGMPDQAEQLMRQAEHIEAEFRGGPHPEHPDRPRPEFREGPPPVDELGRVVRELHGRMEQMQRQMEEMRGVLRELVEREKGRER